MTRLQITTPDQLPDETSAEAALRPPRPADLAGQEQVKASLEMQMLRERVLEKMATAPAVTDEEVTTYFNEHKDNFKEQEQVKARHILARVEVPPPAAGTPNAADNK